MDERVVPDDVVRAVAAASSPLPDGLGASVSATRDSDGRIVLATDRATAGCALGCGLPLFLVGGTVAAWLIWRQLHGVKTEAYHLILHGCAFLVLVGLVGTGLGLGDARVTLDPARRRIERRLLFGRLRRLIRADDFDTVCLWHQEKHVFVNFQADERVVFSLPGGADVGTSSARTAAWLAAWCAVGFRRRLIVKEKVEPALALLDACRQPTTHVSHPA